LGEWGWKVWGRRLKDVFSVLVSLVDYGMSTKS